MNCPDHSAPLLLVAALDAVPIRDVPRFARGAGWRAEIARDLDAVLTTRRADAALLLLVSPGMHGLAEAVARARAAGGLMPIVAILPEACGVRGDLHCPDLDGIVSNAAALRVALDRWRPLATAHPGPRLARTFGDVEVAGLLGRFQAMLVSLFDQRAGSGIDPAAAHQIAGLAGTLGLDELCAAWGAVDAGDPDAAEQAWVVSRKTLFLLSKDPWVRV